MSSQNDRQASKLLQPDQHASTPSLSWQKIAAVLFFLVQSLAVLQAARPVSFLYPVPPRDSGYTFLAEIEQAARRPTPASLDNPLNVYIRLLGIDQQWNTFAPVPPFIYGRYSAIVETDGKTVEAWNDGLPLHQSAPGSYYNPTVKLVDLFKQRSTFMTDAFLSYQARQFQKRTGQYPDKISLNVEYVKIEIDSLGRVKKLPPVSFVPRTLQANIP